MHIPPDMLMTSRLLSWGPAKPHFISSTVKWGHEAPFTVGCEHASQMLQHLAGGLPWSLSSLHSALRSLVPSALQSPIDSRVS